MKAKIVYMALALALTFSLAAVVVPAGPAQAATLCVNPGGTGGCYSSIQAAIDAANPAGGDTINVAAGTYAESLNIGKSLTISGAGAATTSVTGGIVIGGSFDGLTLEGMTLSGDAPGGSNAVIDSSPKTGPVSDITIRDCILDGGDVSGRAAFRGDSNNGITGTWTWDGNEIMNFVNWYVIDNTGSSANVPHKLGDVVFTNNDIHDVAGSIAFRGKIGQEIDTAVVSGNTIDYSDITVPQAWAAVEVNNVLDLEVFDNTVTGVQEADWGGEGQAFQFWSVAPWTVDIYDNTITNNYQGIWISGHLAYGVGYDCYVPSGSIYDNDFVGNTAFGLWISDPPPGSDTSSAIGGPLDAENNWWGHASGPKDTTGSTDCQPPGEGGWNCGACDVNSDATGDKVSENIDYCPWKTRSSEQGGCFIATAAYGTEAAAEIDVLRSFRDEVLLESIVGSQLVEWYYQTSPPVADFISENSLLRTIVRELVIDPMVSVATFTQGIWGK